MSQLSLMAIAQYPPDSKHMDCTIVNHKIPYLYIFWFHNLFLLEAPTSSKNYQFCHITLQF